MTAGTTREIGRDVLTQREAQARAARIGNARYELDLELDRKGDTYCGEATICFDARGPGDTFLDFRGGTIQRLTINGKEIEPAWSDCRIVLPGALLGPESRVQIEYENAYDRTGDGLHRFQDPEDGETYLYTDFEPFSAHRLFPCFDQPDIKATYRLTVTAPEDWELVGNAPVTRAVGAGPGRVTRSFEQTARFSTYLVALIAGPYQAFRDSYGDIPLGLYCRRSMAKHLDADELFTLTKQGFGFFPEFFDYPYPFTKYDQAFVPEYNSGAMENVAAVTFNERMLFRDPPTEHQRLNRAEVLLHEMAHMWFGDLVTMRWWNDLWLNESFATYMSYVAMDHATRFKPAAWKAFGGIKSWAYRQDQLTTTHPIAGEVVDTEHTFLNFDGITYGKGAAAMKQLVAAIGEDAFRTGMRRYFRQHQYSNATLREFLDALSEATPAQGGRDLNAWSRVWLEQASLNTLSVDADQESGRIARLRVLQAAPSEHPTLRPHRVDIALGIETGGTLSVESLPVHVDGAETDVPLARGKPWPAFVFPNHGDLTFAKVTLDPASLAYVTQRIERIDDPLLRQLLGASLWNMVRDQQLASTAYLSLLREKLPFEEDLESCEAALATAAVCLARYVPDERREAEASALCNTALKAISITCATETRRDARVMWARALTGAAYSAKDLELAARLADGQIEVEGLVVDQDARWTIAIKQVARGMAGAEERLAEERRRDPTDRGQRAAVRAEAARPDPAAKASAWERIHGEGFGSLQLTAAAMSGFNWSFQRALLEPYEAAFFDRVKGVFESRPNEYALIYFNHLFPHHHIEPAVLDRSRALLQEPGISAVLTRMLREANDELARSIACRAFASADLHDSDSRAVC